MSSEKDEIDEVFDVISSWDEAIEQAEREMWDPDFALKLLQDCAEVWNSYGEDQAPRPVRVLKVTTVGYDMTFRSTTRKLYAYAVCEGSDRVYYFKLEDTWSDGTRYEPPDGEVQLSWE